MRKFFSYEKQPPRVAEGVLRLGHAAVREVEYGPIERSAGEYGVFDGVNDVTSLLHHAPLAPPRSYVRDLLS